MTWQIWVFMSQSRGSKSPLTRGLISGNYSTAKSELSSSEWNRARKQNYEIKKRQKTHHSQFTTSWMATMTLHRYGSDTLNTRRTWWTKDTWLTGGRRGWGEVPAACQHLVYASSPDCSQSWVRMWTSACQSANRSGTSLLHTWLADRKKTAQHKKQAQRKTGCENTRHLGHRIHFLSIAAAD